MARSDNVTDQELLRLVQEADLPADVAIRIGNLLRRAGTPGPTGPTGATGATGPAGPAPSGTGFVHVTSGVLDTPAELTGDVAAGATGVTTIGNNKVTTAKIADDNVTLAKLANIAAARILGSIAGGDPAELTGTQVTTLLDVFTSALKGLVPASGGGTTNFLRADGTFAIPSGVSAGSNNLQFGDGSDGDGTMDGTAVVAGHTPTGGNTYTLLRDIQMNNLTINSGVTLKGPYRVYVKGTLTLNGKIANNGNAGGNGSDADAGIGNGVLGAGGAALSAGLLPGGVSGGNGGSGSSLNGVNGTANTSCAWPYRGNGGAGATGGTGNGGAGTGGVGVGPKGGPGGGGGAGGGNSANNGGNGGNGGNITGATNDNGNILNYPQCTSGRTTIGGLFGLGTGGGGGGCGKHSGTNNPACGGGGGSSGGYTVVAANVITGSGSIEAKGGNGGNGGNGSGGSSANEGGGGGGAGGSGGTLICIIGSGSFPTCSVAGGAKGLGGNKKGTGGTGGDGSAGADGVLVQYTAN